MNGMTIREFYDAMIKYDEIEFTYHGIEYMFNKTSIPDNRQYIEVTIWSGEPQISCRFKEIAENSQLKLDKLIQNIFTSPILLDGKTLKEAESDIYVTVLFG